MQVIRKVKLSYFAIPLLAWAAVVLPATIAGAADGKRKPASVAEPVKQLRGQVGALQQQITAGDGRAPQRGERRITLSLGEVPDDHRPEGVLASFHIHKEFAGCRISVSTMVASWI